MYSSAHYLLQGLTDLNVEYVFSNLGTDHATILEELARWRKEGRPHPRFVLCAHENVAIHMAAGYAAMTGRGQAVMVHVDAGTANAAMGMHNMFRSRLPVMLMAGRSPHTLHGELQGSRDNYVHFVQDPFDIGSLVRPYVKWEYTLSTGVNAREVLRRGHAVMQSDPPGPVYLTLPREALAEQWEEEQVREFSEARYGPVALGGIDEQRAGQIAQALMDAEKPIAVAAYLGRSAQAMQALEELAMLCGIAVYEFSPFTLNISRESPCFAGFDPAPGVAEADLGLLLDVDVPWLPKYMRERPETRWVHIDVDPIKKDFPMWGFATDMRVQADCATVLRQVIGIVEARADDAFRARVRGRMAQLEAAASARRARAAQAAAQGGSPGAISPAYLCAQLDAAISQDDVIVSEAIRNAPMVLNHIRRTRPQTFLGTAGGGLGYSGGMALGARLARPGVRAIQIVGDGGFHFSAATAVYDAAQRYGLPIFTVVLDNGGWQAVKEAVLRVHPDGAAADADEFHARLSGETREFAQVAQAFGAHGERVADPAEVGPAIRRCLEAVDAGRAALLHVQIGNI
ncbi:Benzoylformate decarboxylase [Pigmentiphaga humi]|uniref:Benzoylformate decarboxylase n=1 Tax=Pigmentiphaga humi TaxID=2478468 RepID=A0A3P4AYV9_9BURK|nr:thiamine pyrophosphate-requiring protein [Pigmentiphaga humi]VCU69223.1 Benzoylformate decarboxylase [Pigmentiphaga humi]